MNYAEIEALHKLSITQLTQHTTQSPLMPVKLNSDVAANFFKDLKKTRLQTMKCTQSKFALNDPKPLIIDLQKPHKFLLPKNSPSQYANAATGSLEYRGHYESSPEILVKHNQIFQTRMVHPLGTMMGERLQKAISMQQIKEISQNQTKDQTRKLLELKAKRQRKTNLRQQHKVESLPTESLVLELQRRKSYI